MTAPTPKNILLTGPPGCGKTTVVRRVIDKLADWRLAGFYTQEIREGGQRVGFEAIGLGGNRSLLAQVRFEGQRRVGRYVVAVEEFERLVEAELGVPQQPQVQLWVIDEIGKMECFSQRFVELVTGVLDGPVPVLATVASKGGGPIAQIKMRPDVELLRVTANNRDDLPGQLALRFKRTAIVS